MQAMLYIARAMLSQDNVCLSARLKGGIVSERGKYVIELFTARRACIARTMPWQDVCLSVRPSVTCWY